MDRRSPKSWHQPIRSRRDRNRMSSDRAPRRGRKGAFGQKKYDIELWTTHNEVKASIVERFNRTLKNRMYKYFTANNTRRYLDILDDLVTGYNNTVHTSIGMKPVNVTESDQVRIRQKLYGKPVSKGYKYKIGEHVRISKSRRLFKKGYLPNWTDEVFIITGQKRLGTEPVYNIQDLNKEEIEGTFYEVELQRIQLPDEFRVEKVLRKKKVGKKTLHLVKWLGWDNSFNSWVVEEDLRKL